jgi:hypothetical protein
MNARAIAHGRAARATLAWLHGREVPAITLGQPVDYGAEHEPQVQEAIETEISVVPACAVGEMLHLGADGRHLGVDRDAVRRALALAARLGDGDPVDYLETIFDDLVACLRSPKIRHAVAALASALIRAPGGEMAATDVAERTILAMSAPLPPVDDQMEHPRKIWVR